MKKTGTTETSTRLQIRIVAPDYRDDHFWVQMGPRFMDQSLLKEIPKFTDRGYTWFLAELDGRMIACAAVGLKGEPAVPLNLWVMPEYRDKCVGQQLAAARLDYFRGYGAHLEVVSESSRKI